MRVLLLLLLLSLPALSAPLPPELRWIDAYRGVKPITGPKEPAGENDYVVTGESVPVYQVLRDKLVDKGWKARERYDFPKYRGKGKDRVNVLRYCDFTRGDNHIGMQVLEGDNGLKLLTIYWYNWQYQSATPTN